MKNSLLSDEQLKAISYVICTPRTAEWLGRVVLFLDWDIFAVYKGIDRCSRIRASRVVFRYEIADAWLE
ncbi:MAG: hypothetical protein U9N07_00350 [Euryarchaeota archaeon]|nr:hypothetical protein [Euryarchaeota archaeon]